ncbi:MAG: cytochrome C oxidase subunit IV family protein [Vicinamibacterales bacterium]|nr:cytochrome C oxidase subunit IV family protein [Vicinamibacterales bacterium]
MSGHVSPKSVYYSIFGALLTLTGITVGVAFINLGRLNFPVAISIAILKATLVVLFFMHAKYSSRLTKLVIGAAFFFLLTLFGLTLTDYLSRGWYAAPGGTATAGTIPSVEPAPSAPPSLEGEPRSPSAAP